MARVLFVFSVDGHTAFNRRPLPSKAVQMGLSYVSAALRAAGHETRLVVLESRGGSTEWRLIDEQLEGFRPDLVGHTAVASQFPFVAAAAQHIRAAGRDVFQIVGGPHASLNPQAALDAGFDAVCVGEGEQPMVELARQIDDGRRPSNIGNLWFRRDDKIEVNPTRPFRGDLDTLPWPDREMWKPWLDQRGSEVHTVFLGRGCPFQCTYCCNHALKRLADGEYVRMRSPNAIVAEVAALAAPPDVDQEMSLEVETIMLKPAWAEELCNQLAALNAQRSRPIRFRTNVRVTPAGDYERVFAAFAQANIRLVDIGLESGSDRVRREILQRHYRNEDVLRAVAAARRHGLKFGLFNLIGVPGETYADFLETTRMNRRCQPDWDFTSIFFPYPGTRLHAQCIAQGACDVLPNGEHERRVAVLDLPTFPAATIQRCYDHFPEYVRHSNPLVRELYIAWKRWGVPLTRQMTRLPGYWFARRMLGQRWRSRELNVASDVQV